MDVAMVGLGRMGGNMARRLLRGGHRVVVWNRTYAKAEELAAEGAEPVRTLGDVVAALPQPRVIWLMLPYGDTTQDAIDELVPLLAAGDILIDGGNSPFQDDVRRGTALAEQGIRYLDAELLRLRKRAVPHHDPVTAAQQAPRHVAAHAAQADHGDVHQDLLVRTGGSARDVLPARSGFAAGRHRRPAIRRRRPAPPDA